MLLFVHAIGLAKVRPQFFFRLLKGRPWPFLVIGFTVGSRTGHLFRPYGRLAPGYPTFLSALYDHSILAFGRIPVQRCLCSAMHPSEQVGANMPPPMRSSCSISTVLTIVLIAIFRAVLL